LAGLLFCAFCLQGYRQNRQYSQKEKGLWGQNAENAEKPLRTSRILLTKREKSITLIGYCVMVREYGY